LEQLAVSSEIELSEIGFNQIRGFAAEMRDMGVDVPADFLQEGILERDDHYVLIVPAHVVPNPVSTVGMGDTISSSSFAYQWSPGISR
jgi:ADP-dependent phosphofructokinase/glucokinase